MRRRESLYLLGLAGLVTLVNAAKPLTVDDSVYYLYARQIADHPLDPYGFLLFGHQPANEVLAPPVLLYWWAAALRLFGEQPVLWKLWLFPFPALLAFAFHALCRRFARGVEAPLTALTLLSPVFLPSLNLMLDVPAVALSLGALAVFLRACDRGSFAGAALAGLIAGVAMQTKYTGFTAPAAMLLYAACTRRLGPGLVAAAVSAALFVGWEWQVARTYGASHFLLALREREVPPGMKLRLALPLLGNLGGVAPAFILVGLAGLGAARRVAVLAAGAVCGGYALVAFVPPSYQVLIAGSHPGRPLLSVNTLVFGLLGLAVIAAAVLVSVRLFRPDRIGDGLSHPWRRGRVEVFLALWLGVEVVGYFVLSPYPAVRRVMGLFVAGTLLGGRLASRRRHSWPMARRLWAAAALSALLGVVCFAADDRLYRAERRAAGQAVRTVLRHDPRATLWFYDSGGAFQYYARKAGMRAVEAGGPARGPHDWLAIPIPASETSAPLAQGPGGPPPVVLRQQTGLPLRSRYQIGGTPLEQQQGPLLEVFVFPPPSRSGT